MGHYSLAENSDSHIDVVDQELDSFSRMEFDF